MSKMRIIPFCTLLLIVIYSCSKDAGSGDTGIVTTDYEGYSLVWHDEFEGTEINTDNWEHEVNANGGGNNELQYYTDRSENVAVQNGYLLLTANKEDFEGSSYTSARILTKGLFEQTYGRFEARIKLPSGQGIWPAFWLLGANIEEEKETLFLSQKKIEY